MEGTTTTISEEIKNNELFGLTFTPHHSIGGTPYTITNGQCLVERNGTNQFTVSFERSPLIAEASKIQIILKPKNRPGYNPPVTKTVTIPNDTGNIMQQLTPAYNFCPTTNIGGKRRTRRHKRKAKKTRKSRSRR